MAQDQPLFLLEVDDAGRSTDVEAEDIGERIETPFDPDQIEVQTRNPTVGLLLNRLQRGDLDLAPDFQRRAGIWKPQAQSRLIESLLLRITLPTLYAAENPDDSWAIVDGVQRLTTIARFVIPEAIGAKPLQLSGLEYLTDYEGATFHDLPGRLKTRIEETELVVLLIRKGTPEPVKFNIFGRINTGGSPLTRQELRHALIPGRARELLAELALSGEYQTATVRSVSSERMSDREMCLRYLAFSLTPPDQYRTQDFDGFLREAMHRINELEDAQIERYRSLFAESMEASYRVFGANAFRKRSRGTSQRFPVNKALFEAQAVNLAFINTADLETLASKKEIVESKFIDLMEDRSFFTAVSAGTGDIGKVRYRFRKINEMFREVIDA